MQRSFITRALILVVLAALLRLTAAALAPHPGISDSNHYYNWAVNIAQGRGFVVDILWNYHMLPADITHPEDYWMPLPAVYPALTMRLFGVGLFVALLPSVLFGAGSVLFTLWLARRVGFDEDTSLLAAALIALMPELVLNSARTDTTISYVLYMGLACACFYLGWRGRAGWWLAAGVCAGLAHLTRQDSVMLIPAFAVTVLIYARWEAVRWHALPLIALGWVVVLLPWIARNWAEFGFLLPSGAGRTLFMTSFIDQFTYGRTLDLAHYLNWGVGNIVRNVITMALANVRTLTTLPDVYVPLAGYGGLLALLWRRDPTRPRDRWAIFIMPLVLIGGLFLFYSFVTPFHTQGGSFKKSAMLLLPFLAIAAAWATLQYVQPKRVAWAVAAGGLLLMGMNTFQLVRTDFDAARRFDDSVQALAVRLNALGDVNGDGEIIVMTQDPFILRYHGFRALMLPSDPRDMILAAAYRYHVDYIILPAARDALDTLYRRRETDPRLVWQDGTGNYELLTVVPSVQP